MYLSAGAESLAVAQKGYAVSWFPSNELNLVLGFLTAAALLVKVRINL